MKNLKRIAALIGVGAIVVLLCLSMIFAMGEGETAQMLFRGTFASAFILPILLYIFLMVYKVVKKEKEPQEAKVKNIVFDVGKVLMSFEWKDFLKEKGYSGEALEKIANATFMSEIWQERDRGLLTEEEYVAQCVALAPEYEEDIRRVMQETYKTVKVYPYAETWVKYLKKKGYHLYIISNFSHYMLEKLEKEMVFRKYMDGEIFSCNVNELKPDAAIYDLLLKKYILNPAECVMVDDRPENCEGARKIGMHAVQFKNFKQATEELKKFGVV